MGMYCICNSITTQIKPIMNTNLFKIIKRVGFIGVLPMLVFSSVVCAQTQARTIDWQGKRYDLATNLSPYDSARTVTDIPIRLGGISREQLEVFQSALLKLYSGVTVERVATTSGFIQRYIITERNKAMILEKESAAMGMVLYFKDGMAVTEMKFYKLLTAYYEE